MPTNRQERYHIMLLSFALCFGPTMTSKVTAQEHTNTSVETSRQFSTITGEKVSRAQELLTADDYDAAINELSAVLTVDDLTPYEYSVIYQMQGSAFYEDKQFKRAIEAFEAAISSGGLLLAEASILRLNIAQLLIANGEFETGAAMLENWGKSEGELTPKHMEMLWQAYSQAELYQRALPWAEEWFNRIEVKERQHFDPLNFLYNKLKMPEKQAGLVKKMIDKWPDDKSLWDTLASILANNGQEMDAFHIRIIQYEAGQFSDQSELLQLIQYYSYYGIPYWAANIMEAEMDGGRINPTVENFILLADLWRQAREFKRAIPVLEKAVSLSGGESEYSKLAEALYHQGHCERAENSISKIANSGSPNISSLYTQLGVCYYEQSQEHRRPDCELSDAAKADSSRLKYQSKAQNAFSFAQNDRSAANRKVAQTASSWKDFIKTEQALAVEICEVGIAEEKYRCFEEIRQAYEAVFVTVKFKVEEACMVFKAEYDMEYRPSDQLQIAKAGQ